METITVQLTQKERELIVKTLVDDIMAKDRICKMLMSADKPLPEPVEPEKPLQPAR